MKITSRALLPIAGTLLMITTAPAYTQDQAYRLSVKPGRCISLHEGQRCYQTLEFTWQTPETGNYCLYQLLDAEAPTREVCWSGNQRTSHKVEFVSDRTRTFQLRAETDEEVLASVEVEVAWVYRSGPKNINTWRLF